VESLTKLDRESLKVLKYLYKNRDSDIDVDMVKTKFKKIKDTKIVTILNGLRDSGFVTNLPNFDITKFGYDPMLNHPIFNNSSLDITQKGIVLVESYNSNLLRFWATISIPAIIALIVGLLTKK